MRRRTLFLTSALGLIGLSYALIVSNRSLSSTTLDQTGDLSSVFRPNADVRIAGTMSVSTWEIPEGVTVSVSRDLIVDCSRDIAIRGRLVATQPEDAVGGEGISITLRTPGMLTLSGAIQAGDGASSQQGMVAGRGGDVLVEAETIIGTGLIWAGNGGAGSPGSRGGDGGKILLYGVTSLPDSESSLVLQGGNGGRGGDGVSDFKLGTGGDGGDGGDALVNALSDGTPGTPGSDVTYTLCASKGAAGIGCRLFADGGSGGIGASAVAGDGGRGGDGIDAGNGGNGGRGGNATAQCGGAGGNGYGPCASDPGGNGGSGNRGGHATGGHGGDGGHGGAACETGQAGNGGAGGNGGNATGGRGGNGGNGGAGQGTPGGDGAKPGLGGNAISGSGGNGGNGGNGDIPSQAGVGGAGGLAGTATAGNAGTPGLGGSGTPPGQNGAPGNSGSSTTGTSGVAGIGGTASSCGCYTLQVITSGIAGRVFGNPASNAGDVNNDGYPDIIVSEGVHDTVVAGRVYVYSGLTGEVLHTFNGETAHDGFGYSVAGAGDVNNDGYDDLIVGAPHSDAGGNGSGRTYLYSGHTGALLRVFTGEPPAENGEWLRFFSILGVSVSGAGDVNNDGYADIIVGSGEGWYDRRIACLCGAYHVCLLGGVHVYSGLTGEMLHHHTWDNRGPGFGYYVAGPGDVNADSYDDYMTSVEGGPIYVFSGCTGGLMYGGLALAYDSTYGVPSVSGAGDVNQDGYPDFIIGALPYPYGSERGHVYVCSGRTGAVLFTLHGPVIGEYFGASVAGAGDVDGDGYPDVLVGTTADPCTYSFDGLNPTYLYSGRNGVLLATFSKGSVTSAPGSGLGDINGDGRAEVIVGHPWRDSGAVHIYTCPGLCVCKCHADAQCDGSPDVLDVVQTINVAFRGQPAIPDPYMQCPYQTTDVDCSGDTGILDVVHVINVAFRGMSAATEFCVPCP